MPAAKSRGEHPAPASGPVTTPAGAADPSPARPATLRLSRVPPRDPGQAAALRPLPASPALRAARPVGARTDPAGTLRAAVTGPAMATAAFSSSAQAPAASGELQSEPRRGQRESRRLRGVHHHQVPALVRAARRKCHQRPFRSAPHFRPEPQSRRGRLERPHWRESPGAGAGSQRKARQRHLAGSGARSSRCREPGAQAAASRDFPPHFPPPD